VRLAAAIACFACLGIARADDRKPKMAQAPSDEDFVDLTTVIPDAVIDMRYATANNFTKRSLYASPTCKLRRAVAARLAKAADALRGQERRLLVWDCYRPVSVQKVMWKLVPDPRYVADPAHGSRHNCGASIDVGLVDKDGAAVVLPTNHDDFSTAAHRDRALAGKRGLEARKLDAAMSAAGFAGLATEWWHFDAPDASKYAQSDDPL
jgi:D-alanyl-D-alanine dipeptidase